MALSCAVVVLLILLAVRGPSPTSPVVDSCEDDEGTVPLPMSSRGFARQCCGVYPKEFGKYKPDLLLRPVSLFESLDRAVRPWAYPRGFFEAGVHEDQHYFFKKPLGSRETVYVVTPDLSAFVEVFLKLPPSARITLVTGSEDIGAPWEIFHPNRTGYFDYNMAKLWPIGQRVSMRQFIADPRLVKWFAQNYDLRGCNPFSCSDVDPKRNKGDALLLAKVEPLPIGLDLHTLSEKVRGADASTIDALICHQRKDISEALRGGAARFQDKPLTAYAEFGCNFGPVTSKGTGIRILTRGMLCKLLGTHRHDPRFVTPLKHSNSSGALLSAPKETTRETKVAFWRRVAGSAFAFAPPGFGMDTHRVWEILQMHTVPIVISSPLDALYSGFPVVVVKSWQEAFEAGALELFKRAVVDKFGPEPFSQAVNHKLSAQYWLDKVRAAGNNASSIVNSV